MSNSKPLNDYEKHLIEHGIDPADLVESDDEEYLVNNKYKKVDIDQLDRDLNKHIKGFTELLETLSSTEERKKALWKQIYEYALTDRKNAFILFGDLYEITANNSAEHAVHGATLNKYIERMQKANEQLIKLAELVSDAIDEKIEDDWSSDSMYDMLEKSSGSQTKKTN